MDFLNVLCVAHGDDEIAMRALGIIGNHFPFETLVVSRDTPGIGMVPQCSLVLKTFHPRERVKRREGKYLRAITKDIYTFLPHWVGDAKALIGFYPDAFYRATLYPKGFEEAIVNVLSHGKMSRILLGDLKEGGGVF